MTNTALTSNSEWNTKILFTELKEDKALLISATWRLWTMSVENKALKDEVSRLFILVPAAGKWVNMTDMVFECKIIQQKRQSGVGQEVISLRKAAILNCKKSERGMK